MAAVGIRALEEPSEENRQAPSPVPLVRIADVDSLRGFALFGILAVNITAFSSAYYGTGLTDPAQSSVWDQAARWLVAMLFEGKFYLLFSFLFGYSFTLQMESAERAGASFVPRMLRRMAGLWCIGMAHAVFLFQGDILSTYAILGLMLLGMRKMPDRLALVIAAVLILLVALVCGVLGLLQWLVDDSLNMAEAQAEAEAATAAYRGSVAEVIRQRIGDLPGTWLVIGFLQAPCALAMFLLGLVAGKRRLLADTSSHQTLLRRMLFAGICVGLPGSLVYAATSVLGNGSAGETFGLALGWLTAPLLTGAYIALAALGFQTPAGRKLAAALAPAGRMALSNYLFQSLVCSLLFTGYGLGLTSQLSLPLVLLVAVAIFAVQLPLSAWWLGRHPYGPLEWLLRAVTNASWPAWRTVGPRH